MTSHEYRFRIADALQLVASPICALALVGMLLHAAVAVGLMPGPWPAVDMDRTILLHQAVAASRRHDARLLLVGDSSCLMDVSAEALGARLHAPALNLATISYVNLESHARIISRFARANPGQLDAAVLLLHPNTLRLGESATEYIELLRHALVENGNASAERVQSFGQSIVADLLGTGIVRQRLLGRVVPKPLPGAYGARYGFTWNLWKHMTAERGSLVDPHKFDRSRPVGSAEYRMSERVKAETKEFRHALPRGVRLAVGLTPVPESFAHPDHAAVCQGILHSLGDWLAPACVLTGLPATMPDDKFATVTHLNERGRMVFTSLLAAELDRGLMSPR